MTFVNCFLVSPQHTLIGVFFKANITLILLAFVDRLNVNIQGALECSFISTKMACETTAKVNCLSMSVQIFLSCSLIITIFTLKHLAKALHIWLEYSKDLPNKYSFLCLLKRGLKLTNVQPFTLFS